MKTQIRQGYPQDRGRERSKAGPLPIEQSQVKRPMPSPAGKPASRAIAEDFAGLPLLIRTGRAAAALGVSKRVLRKLEGAGLLHPIRMPNGYRYFRKIELQAVFMKDQTNLNSSQSRNVAWGSRSLSSAAGVLMPPTLPVRPGVNLSDSRFFGSRR